MADKDRSETEPAFKVTDHRRIHLDEETGAPEGPASAATGHSEGAASAHEAEGIPDTPPEGPSKAAMAEAERQADAAAASGKGQRHAAPELEFTTFVLSLGSSALVHLGDAPHPDTGKPEPNLTMAKQTIDMLAMLKAKTKGNLDREEASYLDALLYDLRLRFVDASKRHG